MNIFVLDENPSVAARMHCDKHVVKMVLEATQMICNIFPQELVPYKRTHVNHPCSTWARESSLHATWLFFYASSLCYEYLYRYDKIHKCHGVIEHCRTLFSEWKFPSDEFKSFALAMPDEFKNRDDVVSSYRNYYRHKRKEWMSKGRDMRYTKCDMPDWLEDIR